MCSSLYHRWPECLQHKAAWNMSWTLIYSTLLSLKNLTTSTQNLNCDRVSQVNQKTSIILFPFLTKEGDTHSLSQPPKNPDLWVINQALPPQQRTEVRALSAEGDVWGQWWRSHDGQCDSAYPTTVNDGMIIGMVMRWWWCMMQCLLVMTSLKLYHWCLNWQTAYLGEPGVTASDAGQWDKNSQNFWWYWTRCRWY